MNKNNYTYTFFFFTFIFILFSCQQNDKSPKNEATEKCTADSLLKKEENSKISDTILNPTTKKTNMEDSKIKRDTAEKVVNVPLRILIDNLRSDEGEVEVAVYTPDNKFPDEKDKFRKYRFKPKNNKVDEMVTDIPYGELAIALYHDENNNGIIDKNMLGIPKEDYAFSNNFRPTVKVPSFKDCKFSYSKESSLVHITIKR